MKSILLLLLLQSAPIPPRMALANPASFTEVPKPLKKDYDKLWTRFQAGNDAPSLIRDLDKLVKGNPAFTPAITIEAYIDEIHGRTAEAEQKFNRVLSIVPNDRIALSYLADLAFERQNYPRAVDLYGRLLQADPDRTDVEPKRQKAMILGTDGLLRQAQQAEQEKRFADAESFYRQALQLAPGEASLYARLGALLANEKKWSAALSNFEKQRELSGPSQDVQRHIAEALMNLGRADEAGNILDGLGKNVAPGYDDARNSQLLEDLGRWGKGIDQFRQIQASVSITREQFALLMVRYFPQITEIRPTVRGMILTDIQTSAASPEIQTVLNLGLIEPFPNHAFRPSAPVSRGEFAAVIVRLSKALGISPATMVSPVPTPDVESGNARYGDVQFVLSLGLMTVDDGGNFNIGGPMSGNQAVRTVQRLLDLARKKTS